MQIAHEAPASFRSSAVRPGPLGLIVEAVREAWSRRRLIGYLVSADVKKKGSDTILGNIWWILDPILQMLVYMILLTVIFQRSTPDFPLFLFVAILPWKWFNSSIGDSISSVVRQERLIKQIQFPKIVLPMAAVIAGIVNFLFGLIPLAVILFVFYPAHATVNIAWLPVIAVVQFVFTLALALIVSGINVFYRDIGNLSTHLMRLWFYLSPALWSFDRLGDRFSGGEGLGATGFALLQLNPFAILFTAYREAIYGRVDPSGEGFVPGFTPDLVPLGALLLVSLGLLAVAIVLFKRLEPAFAKVL